MFNSERWTLLVEQAYGYKSVVIDNFTPALFYSEVTNEMGEYAVAPPFGDFIWLTIDQLSALSRFAGRHRDWAIRLKVCANVIPTEKHFITEPSGYVHQINYTSYDEWSEALITCKFRNQVNQGRRNGLAVNVSRDESAILDFWKMHANLRVAKFGEIPQPKAFFLHLHRMYLREDLGFVINACDKSGNLIAGIIVLVDNGTAYYKFAASISAALALRPNNLLFDRLIAYLDEIGIKKVNLGFTGGTTEYNGLRKFKLSAGAEESQRYTMRTGRYESLKFPEIGEINRKVIDLINGKPTLEAVDQFSERHYKYFV